MVPRVAVVIPRYHPIFGGAENQCRLLNRYLLRSGAVEIPFLATRRIRSDLEDETIEGVSVKRLGAPGIDRWSEYHFCLMAAAYLTSRRREFDLIHCHATAVLGFSMTLAGRRLGKPVVLKISSNGELLEGFAGEGRSGLSPRRLVRSLRQRMARRTARSATLVALNQEGYREACAAGATRAVVIPNGVDRTEFFPLPDERRGPLRRSYGLEPAETALLFVGRFVENKGLDLLLDAFERLLARPGAERLRLCLAGSGELQINPAEERLRWFQARYPDRLLLLPPKIPASEYYQIADAFVSPSRREGLPNVVLEALASGLPCILSDIAPHRELAEENPNARVRLFRSGDADALAKALQGSLEENGKARRDVALSDRFEIERVAGCYAELYRRALAGRVGEG